MTLTVCKKGRWTTELGVPVVSAFRRPRPEELEAAWYDFVLIKDQGEEMSRKGGEACCNSSWR